MEAVARSIAEYVTNGVKIVVEKSTVPVKTAECIATILKAKKAENASFHVLSNPEFLAEGTAINDLMNPDRILIGGEDADAIEKLSQVYQHWIAKGKCLLNDEPRYLNTKQILAKQYNIPSVLLNNNIFSFQIKFLQ